MKLLLWYGCIWLMLLAGGLAACSGSAAGFPTAPGPQVVAPTLVPAIPTETLQPNPVIQETATSTAAPVPRTPRATQEDDLGVESITRHEDLGCPLGCSQHTPGCDIKGNISISSGDKIYHVPGSEFYDKTVISPEYGERWFCTEEEALANGWRAPRTLQ